jgi:Tol biopolymer transport system component
MEHGIIERWMFQGPLKVFVPGVLIVAIFSCRSDNSRPEPYREGVVPWKWESGLPADTSIFLPGIISHPDRVEQGITFSPSGDTLVFCAITRRERSRNVWTMFSSIYRSGHWSMPETLSFSGIYSDYGPAFSCDGKGLYFSSRRPVIGTDTVPADYDIWVSEIGQNGWGPPRRLADGVNTLGNEYSVGVSEGELIICSDRHDRSGATDLFSVDIGEQFNDFTTRYNLGRTINTPYWEGRAFVSCDGRELWWNHTGDGPEANEDLMYSDRSKDGWSRPMRLNSTINTPANEYMQCVTPDGRFIFFGRHGDIMIAPAKINQ